MQNFKTVFNSFPTFIRRNLKNLYLRKNRHCNKKSKGILSLIPMYRKTKKSVYCNLLLKRSFFLLARLLNKQKVYVAFCCIVYEENVFRGFGVNTCTWTKSKYFFFTRKDKRDTTFKVCPSDEYYLNSNYIILKQNIFRILIDDVFSNGLH